MADGNVRDEQITVSSPVTAQNTVKTSATAQVPSAPADDGSWHDLSHKAPSNSNDDSSVGGADEFGASVPEEVDSPYSEESWNEYADAGDSYEEDDDDDVEMTPKSTGSKKTLEVSVNRPKTSPPGIGAENSEPSDVQRWKRVVMSAGNPLSSMLMRAQLECFTRNSLEVTLPMAFQGMISEHHIREIDSILARQVGGSCRFMVRYADIGDGTDTLAALEAKKQLEAEQKEFERVREHPVMKRIIEVFHVNPDDIRFTINPDRTFNEQGH